MMQHPLTLYSGLKSFTLVTKRTKKCMYNKKKLKKADLQKEVKRKKQSVFLVWNVSKWDVGINDLIILVVVDRFNI